jgi:hypothetical protein
LSNGWLASLASLAAKPRDIRLPAINDSAQSSLACQTLRVPKETLLLIETARADDPLKAWEKRLRSPDTIAERMLFQLPPQELVERTHALVHRKQCNEERWHRLGGIEVGLGRQAMAEVLR